MDRRRKDWKCPPEEMLPTGSKIVDAKACQSPFQRLADGSFGFEMPVAATEGQDGPQPGVAGIGFVIRVPETDKWLKSSTEKDCVAIFHEVAAAAEDWKGPWKEQVALILESERDWGHMTLMHRYNNAKDMIGKWQSSVSSAKGGQSLQRAPSWGAMFRSDAKRSTSWSRIPSSTLLFDPDEIHEDEKDDELWSWIFVWQRFSFIRLLDWQRNYNTKPRELAGATDGLADMLCSAWKGNPHIRLWARWTLATLGRGGNQGQAIRDEILHIMHRNKIPETSGHFYEQWHQKLHNNTTPDDVGICKAVIAFLRSSGDMNTYWKVLNDHGISKERLASYDRSITKEPYLHGDNGRLILEFENYLKILQSVHDALDLQTAIEASKSCLPGDLASKLQDISNSKGGGSGTMRRSQSNPDLSHSNNGSLDDSHGRFMKLADARRNLLGMLNDKKTEAHVIRQLLLLDFALETQQTVLIQGMTSETRLPVLCDQMLELLTAVLGHMPLHGELRALLLVPSRTRNGSLS
eukprot:TRINITY_DN5737_c1_g1_i2.p1 TRINITY_DN5737_c1_g1~~TRINITY_DN5737_c1_g1_i2.p1  ORF type:complete len:583 (+),score=121.12 TRINITY_DN5737_c1_g1_i2:189-1751(+)